MGNMDSALQKATEWITAELKANSKADRLALIDQAGMRFHLSPLEAGY
jgi:hypothetical protein